MGGSPATGGGGVDSSLSGRNFCQDTVGLNCNSLRGTLADLLDPDSAGTWTPNKLHRLNHGPPMNLVFF